MPFPFNTTVGTVSESVTLRDAKGNTAKVYWYVNGTGASGLDNVAADTLVMINALLALSNAAFQRARGVLERYGTAQYGTHASGGAYESVVDKAVMVFQDGSGALHRFEIPAPKIAIFKNDKITVDPANSLVATFITAFSTAQTNGAIASDRHGTTFANFMGGFYKARKIHRRLNVLVLQPDLTPSLPAE